MNIKISVVNLTATYQRHPAVHHVSAEFAPGSLTAIVGPNGAGKTTLLRCLAGLHQPESGAVLRGDLTRQQIALLPQAGTLDPSFPIDCRDVVMLGLIGEAGAFRAMGASDRARAEAALAQVGLHDFARRPVGSLSAGQMQRVLFARLIVQEAPVLLLDEPFNAVDTRTEADLLALIDQWHHQGRTVIAVLHDLDLVRAHFPQCLLLARQLVAFGPTEAVLSQENRQRARMVAEAWVGDAPVCEAESDLHSHEHHEHGAHS